MIRKISSGTIDLPSKSIQKVFSFLARNHEKQYRYKEIARYTKLHHDFVSRILRMLMLDGLVKREMINKKNIRGGNMNYYSIVKETKD